MFNALTEEELLIGIGRVLRSTADAGGPLEDYGRSQVLSAYSVVRLLAAERRVEAELLAWARAELDAALAGDERPQVVAARERIAAADGGVAVGDALADVLAGLPGDDPLRPRLHAVMRELTDREVAALATATG